MMAAADAVTPNGFNWGIEGGDLMSCRIIYQRMIDAALEDADLIAAGAGGIK